MRWAERRTTETPETTWGRGLGHSLSLAFNRPGDCLEVLHDFGVILLRVIGSKGRTQVPQDTTGGYLRR